MIQFCKHRRSGLQFAIKFFLSRSAFDDEAALYTNPASPLGPFLPQLRTIAGAPGYEAGIVDREGNALLPCIVMEKAESLHDWSDRAQPDLFTAMAVRTVLLHSE